MCGTKDATAASERHRDLAFAIARELRLQDSGAVDLIDDGDLTDFRVFTSIDLTELAAALRHP